MRERQVDSGIWWISWLHRSPRVQLGEWGRGAAPDSGQRQQKEVVRESTRNRRRRRGGLLTIDVMIPRPLIGYRSLQVLVPGLLPLSTLADEGWKLGFSCEGSPE